MWGATMLQHLRRGAAVAPVPLVRLVAGPNRLGSAPAHWSLAAAASWRAATKLTAGARRLCAMHPTRVVRVDGDETQVCDAPHALLHVLFSHAPEMHGGQHTEHAILTQVTARDPPEACILTEVTTLHSPPLQGAAATDVTKRVVQVRALVCAATVAFAPGRPSAPGTPADASMDPNVCVCVCVCVWRRLGTWR